MVVGHEDWEKAYDRLRSGKDLDKSTLSRFANKTASDYFGWIELIIMKNLPLSTVEDKFFRKSIKYEKISTPTLKKHMAALTLKVR